MQLENFAGEVFVDASVAIDAGNGVWPHRTGVVEIVQHRRVALDRGQHVDEAAERVGTDRFALIGAGHRGAFVGRNTEVIGPEPNKALDEADLGGEGGFDTDLGLVLYELNADIGGPILLALH